VGGGDRLAVSDGQGAVLVGVAGGDVAICKEPPVNRQQRRLNIPGGGGEAQAVRAEEGSRRGQVGEGSGSAQSSCVHALDAVLPVQLLAWWVPLKQQQQQQPAPCRSPVLHALHLQLQHQLRLGGQEVKHPAKVQRAALGAGEQSLAAASAAEWPACR